MNERNIGSQQYDLNEKKRRKEPPPLTMKECDYILSCLKGHFSSAGRGKMTDSKDKIPTKHS